MVNLVVKISQTLDVLDHKLAISIVSGNKKLADDLLLILIKACPGYKLTIQNELQNDNKEELRKIIHKIHGGLKYVGAPALLDIVQRTDLDFIKLSDEQLEQNISQIFQEIERLINAGKYRGEVA